MPLSFSRPALSRYLNRCRETAPKSFTRDEISGHSFVFHQPETSEEEALCQTAMQNCPVEAIGDNGS
jgi:ferredoxin